MTNERLVTIIIGSVVTGLVGLVFIAIRALVSRAVGQMDTWVKEIKESTDGVKREFNDFRIEAARNYATWNALEKSERENHGSHATIHGRLDKLSDDVIRVRTVQEHCKHCRGES